MRDKITDYLTESQILLQLAEEAAELSAAAAKMARKLDGANPTPKSVEECWDNLVEEYADVEVCLNALEDFEDFAGYTNLNYYYRTKRDRWLKRLQERGKENNE